MRRAYDGDWYEKLSKAAASSGELVGESSAGFAVKRVSKLDVSSMSIAAGLYGGSTSCGGMGCASGMRRVRLVRGLDAACPVSTG